MVASLIRLKRDLMLNSFNRSAWQIVGTIFGLLYGLGIVVAAFFGQFFLGQDPEDYSWLLVFSSLSGSLAMLIWIILPLFFTGGDSLMDPKQFVTYAVPRKKLIAGLVISALIGVATFLTLIWLVGQVVMWRSDAAAMLVALLSLPLLLLLYSTASQAMTTVASAWFDGRRVRDFVVIFGVALLMLLYPLSMSVGRAFDSWGDALPVVAEVLAWTPLGAGAALPYDALTGQWGLLMLRLLVVLGTIGLSLVLIRLSLIKITERPSVPKASAKAAKAGNLGFFSVFPATPWGTIAARALTYWFKDSRYGASIILVPALVLMMVFASLQADTSWMLYGIGPLMAWTLGIAICADISYDNTAFALHVTTGVDGTADRLGRVAALMTFAVPLILLGTVVPILLIGNPADLVLMVGLSLGVFSACAGFSAFISARMTYPVPKPGDNPFKTPPGSGGRMALVQLGSLLAVLILMLPEIVIGVVWLVTGADWLGPVIAAVSVLKGAGLLWGGIMLGARVYDRSQPELFQQVREYS